jgi:uncharacterized protein YrzB (UPF0473 family)
MCSAAITHLHDPNGGIDMSEQFDEFDYTPDIYTLIDEEGHEQEFELLDVMEIDDDRYFALLPYFEDADEALNSDGDLVVLKSEMVDGEEMMITIDDDEEYERVGNLFLEKLADMYEDEVEDIEQNLQ